MATYKVTWKHYRMMGIGLLLAGTLMTFVSTKSLIQGLTSLPKEIKETDNHLFRAQSAGKHTFKSKSGSSTKYTIYYKSANGKYELYEELPEGTAILKSQLANKQTKRTVFTYDSDYYVGSSENMTPEQGLSEMKKSVLNGNIPLIVIGAALLGTGIWFQFVSKSRKKTGPVETITV